MEKFSVKKPLTVFVAVIAVLVLGVVAYLKMTPDLLPNMDFPYVMIMTTYPGASPEKVEQEITKPMEQAMATLEHIKEVSSTSAENYSMLLLEFEDSVNMDTIGVDIQGNIDTLASGWDEMVSAPYVLKINPSLLPVAVAAVSMEGMDTVALTQFLDEELLNKLEGTAGVARISTTGAIRQELHVILDQKKIDKVNKTIADTINREMDKALEELNQTKSDLEFAQDQMAAGKTQLEEGKQALSQQTAAGEAELSYQQAQLVSTRAELQAQLLQLQSTKTTLESTLSLIKPLLGAMEQLTEQADGIAADIDAVLGLSEELEKLLEALKELENSADPDGTMTPEELEAALKEDPQYQLLLARIETIKAELAARGVDIENIQAWLESANAALTDLRNRVTEIENILNGQNIDPASLGDKIKELEDSLPQIDAGIAAIEDGIRQIDSGMLQLKDAQLLLSSQKTQGLLDITAAANELAVNGATVTAAMTQIEGGLETLETTREETLKKADMTNLLTMEMVSNILTAQNFYMPAGTVTQEGVSYMVSVGEEITDEKTLRELLLFDMGMEGVEPVYLSDVAAVMVTDNREETYAKLDGKDGLVLSFEKQSTSATAETTNNLLDRFEKLEQEYEGLRFVMLMNQGDYIYLIVETILSSLLLGAALAVVILYLFLRDLRPTVITLCSIPISVVFAIVLMYFSGVTINMISLSGLAVAVGMLVDNSVVVIENIYRLRAKGANAIQAAVSGAKQVAGAVTASTLTTVCVFLPIVFVEGITKQLFTDLALTMTYALLASLIVALTLVPAMASGMLRKEHKKTEAKWLSKLLEGYEMLLNWALSHKAAVLGAAGALLAVTAALAVARGYIFMPEMDMPNVSVSITMPEGADLQKRAELADEVLSRIDGLDGIATVGAMQGGGSLMTGLTGGDSSGVTVYITLEDEGASGAAVGRQIEEMCRDLECEITTTSMMMDMSMLTGSGISLELYCDDIETLQSAAKTAADVLGTLEGVTEVSNGLEDTVPALHVAIDRNKAMAKGITVAQIFMELAAALPNTTTVTTLDLNGTATELIVEKTEESRVTADSLADFTFTFTNTMGEEVELKLSDVAVVEKTTSLAAISRVSQRRLLTVSAAVTEDANVTLVTREAEKLMADVDLGEGVTYAFTGENEAIMEAVEQLLLMLLLGVLLVYLVMVAQFQSLKSPFIVMFTIPLAFTGGFLGLLVCGLEVSVISLIGFVMLTGIIVNNGIVLVDYINQLRLEGMDRRAAILDAGKTRMRPILMTTLTTILGLLDMALSRNVGTSLMQPVAVVCIGGLLYATLMTLFVVPCIYDMMNKKALRNVREEDLKLLDM